MVCGSTTTNSPGSTELCPPNPGGFCSFPSIPEAGQTGPCRHRPGRRHSRPARRSGCIPSLPGPPGGCAGACKPPASLPCLDGPCGAFPSRASFPCGRCGWVRPCAVCHGRKCPLKPMAASCGPRSEMYGGRMPACLSRVRWRTHSAPPETQGGLQRAACAGSGTYSPTLTR